MSDYLKERRFFMIRMNLIVFVFFLFNGYVFAQVGVTQTGKASYYADKFHGNKTTSGERYDKNDYTAAHREYAFHTLLKVTNLKNNKSVIVRVNDKGPHKKERIIDISKAAAIEIDLVKMGVADVKIEVVEGVKPGKITDAKTSETPAKTETNKTKTTDSKTTNPSESTPKNKDVKGKSSETTPKTTETKPSDSKTNKDTKAKTNEVPVKTTDNKSDDSNPKTTTEEKKDSDTTAKTDVTDAKKSDDSSASKTGDLSFPPDNIYTLDGNPATPNGYGIQIGTFSHPANALKFCKDIESLGFAKVYIKSIASSGFNHYKVMVGEYSSESEMQTEIGKLKEKNLEFMIKKY